MGTYTVVQMALGGVPWYDPPLERPIMGIALHHTATPNPAAYTGASVHVEVGRVEQPNGLTVVRRYVPDRGIAHGIGNTDRFWPPWVPTGKTPFWSGSKINYVCLHAEIVYAPQAPHLQIPTPAQYRTVREVIADWYRLYGPLPVIGHGTVDTTKWRTEPHWINGDIEPTGGRSHWDALGLTREDEHGHWLEGEADMSIVDELNTQVAALEAEIRHLNGQINELNGQQDERESQIAALREELAARQADVAQLLAKLAAAPAPTIVLPQRVDVVHADGTRFGFIPEA